MVKKILAVMARTMVLYCFVSTTVAAGEFESCISRLQTEATARGYQGKFIKLLGDVRYLPKVIELDRHQPEFSETFASYLSKRVTDFHVSNGRKLLIDHQELLAKLAKKYGIPAHYLLAFWGLETNYGRYKGKMPVLDSLATLACDQRRSEFFTAELFAALKMLDTFGIGVGDMQGSWAGAVGHTQFMPSVYLAYAVDGDGDQRINLWRSSADALTSAANYLNKIGWQKHLPWGKEVILPSDFSYQDAGLETWRAKSYWGKTGVKTTQGLPITASGTEFDLNTAIIVPAGHKGPAFMVYENFNVIMRWNRSIFYAITVGYLADRISGGGILVNFPVENSSRLSRVNVELLQQRLADRGYVVGKIDGIIGPSTRKAIRQFQLKHGHIADGYPNAELFKILKIGLD